MTGSEAHHILYRLAYQLQEARKAARDHRFQMAFNPGEAQELADALAIAVISPDRLVDRSDSEEGGGDGG